MKHADLIATQSVRENERRTPLTNDGDSRQACRFSDCAAARLGRFNPDSSAVLQLAKRVDSPGSASKERAASCCRDSTMMRWMSSTGE